MAREPEDLAEMRRELGAQLTVFRVAAELTQGQLGQVAWCDRTNVADIEKGRSRVTSASGRSPMNCVGPRVCSPPSTR